MYTGKLVYKCRRCDAEVADLSSHDFPNVLQLLIEGKEIPKEQWGMDVGRVTMFDLHKCSDDKIGIMDLQGCDLAYAVPAP